MNRIITNEKKLVNARGDFLTSTSKLDHLDKVDQENYKEVVKWVKLAKEGKFKIPTVFGDVDFSPKATWKNIIVKPLKNIFIEKYTKSGLYVDVNGFKKSELSVENVHYMKLMHLEKDVVMIG